MGLGYQEMTKFKNSGSRYHSKASEKYVDVTFYYDGNVEFETSIPIEYRRTGTLIEDADVDVYLLKIYDEVNPKNWEEWNKSQTEFWASKAGAGVTKSFFDELCKNFSWCCVSCTLPSNPNWARRIQDLKEFGYTIATNTNRPCSKCKKNTTQLILSPIKRGGVTGYETWSPELRNKIISTLKAFDAYEGKLMRKEGLLPDHKFPEIRWDLETKRHSLEHLTEEDIRKDFQLLSNQRNQQKREVCRACYQTGSRGIVHGIPFFYSGGPNWDEKIPKTGKGAEKGCVGCAWYDIDKWRNELTKKLNSNN